MPISGILLHVVVFASPDGTFPFEAELFVIAKQFSIALKA
jgi:hypothetical protein